MQKTVGRENNSWIFLKLFKKVSALLQLRDVVLGARADDFVAVEAATRRSHHGSAFVFESRQLQTQAHRPTNPAIHHVLGDINERYGLDGYQGIHVRLALSSSAQEVALTERIDTSRRKGGTAGGANMALMSQRPMRMARQHHCR